MREWGASEKSKKEEVRVEEEWKVGIIVSKTTKKLMNALKQLEELEAVCKCGKLVAFSLKGIDKKMLTVLGYTFCREQRTWEPIVCEMPRVVINRISLDTGWACFFRFHLGERMINNFSFSKWEMYQWLSQHPTLINYLPKTSLVKTGYELLLLLDQDEKGYLKPIGRSFGNGIYKIAKQANKMYKVEDKNQAALLLSESELLDFFEKNCKKEGYIFQQMLDLTIGNHPVDFRLIFMKDGNTKWKDLGLILKKGVQGGIISNRGQVKEGTSALKNIFLFSNRKALELRKEMSDIAKMAVSEMELYGGPNSNLGNVGMDIGIDKNNKLWIIEINHRNPRHSMASKAGLENIYQQTNVQLIDYAYALAK
ncbi:YheC/YheD family protein [Alkalihalophilus marmarensis]|uniref:YheC/YheD family protein n=1 Tax=Alkalihalophilus marmarensis TaxID=521377 RepID=UPI002E21736D|nr:YheC/YheD family protein [Alkalihalophilus marmarensis]